MDVEEVREVLLRAAKLRMPRFAADDNAGQKIPPLEDYMLACAIMRGDLEEARLLMRRSLMRLEDEWDSIVGWEATVRGGQPTQRDIIAAKRELRRDVYDGIREAKRLLVELGDQIRRLELDERSNSRVYTYVTGAT